MQRQYVSNATVNFSDFKFFVRPGDVCKHNETTNDFVIYRNGSLAATLKTSVMALKSMMTPETNYFSVIEESTASNVVVVEPTVEEEKIEIINPDVPDSFEEGEIEDLADVELTEVEIGGLEGAAVKGVTIIEVELNEEKPVEIKNPQKVQAVVEHQKNKPGRKPKS